MHIEIRIERNSDYKTTEEIVTSAFAEAEHRDGDEANLVVRLRASSEFIPELSLVAEVAGQLVGHILFSPIQIISQLNDAIVIHPSLALAPVSVLPVFQKQGVGNRLITEGHYRAKEFGFSSVILLGHPAYYPRFGYRPASQFDIRPSFDVPSECFMAAELTANALKDISGVVKYPPEFLI